VNASVVATDDGARVSTGPLDQRQRWATGVAAYALGWELQVRDDSGVDLRESGSLT
jgi:hypothetical protein